MALSPALSDFGSGDSIVDRRIGTAFSYVQVVANNIAEVKYVAHYMEAVVRVANALNTEQTVLVTGVAPALGESVSIPYPTGVTNANLRSSSVLIVATNGVIYNLYPGYAVTAIIEDNALVVDLGPSAPVVMVGGEIRWHITYGDIP